MKILQLSFNEALQFVLHLLVLILKQCLILFFLKQMDLLILALKKCSRCHRHLTPLFGATRSGHTYLPLTTKQNKVKRAEIWSE